MAKRKKTKKIKPDNKTKTIASVKKKYPVAVFEKEDGGLEHRALVTLDEAYTLADEAKKKGLIARITARVKNIFKPQTSDADDEGTTDIGGTVAAVSIGEGFYSTNLYKMKKEEQTRLGKYKDYEKMDEECTELNRALNVTVSNVFVSREGDQESYVIKSKDSQTLKLLEDTDGRINGQEEWPGVCRSLLLFGDDFEEIVIDNKLSIIRIKWLNQKYMHRNEDDFGRLVSDASYIMKEEGSDTPLAAFKPWQVVHTRHDYQRGNLYGRSFFFAARRPWRLLQMMEDGIVMNRLVRAVDRLVYYVPIDKGTDEEEAKRIVEQAKDSMQRRSVVDPNTGKLDLRKSPLADDEDIFIGTNQDNPAKVERLMAFGNVGQMKDIEYIQNKMFMSTSVPKSYLGLERDVNSKATLGWQDIEYARMCRHIQKTVAGTQRRVYDLQLVLLGRTPDKELYQIEYPAISFVDEEMKMSIEQIRWNIAVIARGMDIPLEWVLQNILKLTDEQAHEIISMMEPSQQQPGQFPGPQIPGMIPFGQPSVAALATAREQVFQNQKMVRAIQELHDMIVVIQDERLNQPVRI